MSNLLCHHISATIVTLNEERNIRRCLTSLQEIADEIIVLDSGSQDRTEEICNSFPKVRFIHQEWLGFSGQKQRAVDLAAHDIILSLDADESLSEELRHEILEKKKQGFSPFEAFELKRKTNYCGKWIHFCGWYPDPQLRLFHRQHGHWLQVPIHEHVICEKNVHVNRLSGDIHHYSYYSVSDHLVKIEKYAELGAQGLLKKNAKFLGLKSYTNALSRFIKIYFLKLGFLDGFSGLQIAGLAAYSVHQKYKKAKLHGR